MEGIVLTSIQINVVRSDTSSDGNLEVLGLCQTLCGEVTWVEAMGIQ